MNWITRETDGNVEKVGVTDTKSEHEITGNANYDLLFIGNLSTDTPVHYRMGTDDTVTAVAFTGTPALGDPIVAPGGFKVVPLQKGGTPTKQTFVSFVTESGTADVIFYPFDMRVIR